jgi:hypothetical protein
MLIVLLAVPFAGVRPLAASPGQEFTVSESGVALRAGPSDTAETLRSLTPDHLLVEFSRQGDWVKVGVYREIGAFGWVPADRLVPATRGDGRVVDLASRIPKSYSFKAVAVDCRIRKNDFFGRMRIRLTRAGELLAGKQINGPFNQIWIRSDGPWGPARAILRGGLVVRERPRATPLPN